MTRAITGKLSAEMGDGTVLTDSTDLGLAWQIVEHTHGTDLSRAQSWPMVSEVLSELRTAYRNG